MSNPRYIVGYKEGNIAKETNFMTWEISSIFFEELVRDPNVERVIFKKKRWLGRGYKIIKSYERNNILMR